MSMIAAVLGVLLGAAQNTVDSAYANATVVEGLTVVGAAYNPLLTVTVGGVTRLETIVRSEPVGVRCGEYNRRYASLHAPRLCWIRRPAGTAIVLTAENTGRHGTDWTVEWRGCEPYDDGLRCRLTLEGDSEVEAVFRRVR